MPFKMVTQKQRKSSMRYINISMLLFILFLAWEPCIAQEKTNKAVPAKRGRPPSPVVVADVVEGQCGPRTEYVGTVYYSRISRVAAQIEGLVTGISFEEGDTVRGDQQLVHLETDLQNTLIAGARATHEQSLADLEQAEKDFMRINALFQTESISEAVLDDHFFKKKRLAKKSSALKAELERMLLVKKKAIIAAPFDGVVIEKSCEQGEWVPEGGTVAVIADNREMDVLVDVPEEVLPYLVKGELLPVSFGRKIETARFMQVMPKGDIATRTFPIKLRLKNRIGLIEGMEARVNIPVGKKVNGLLVPRDAVISKNGEQMIFTVSGSKAVQMPIRITGYRDEMAGVSAQGLARQMKVVIKGNERLRAGQAVRIIPN